MSIGWTEAQQSLRHHGPSPKPCRADSHSPKPGAFLAPGFLFGTSTTSHGFFEASQ
jgi:hypothetical protein